MITYSFRQLEAFVWVARLGSFRAAAGRLHVTQPTVSQRVRELGWSLGTALFDRAGYRPRLTRSGASIMPTVERILDLTGDLDRTAGQDGALRGLLRIGVPDTFALVCLPELVARLERQYPELEVDLSVRYSRSTYDHLARRDLDIAFISDPEPTEGITSIPLGSMDLVWFASPAMRLPDRALGPAELAHVRIITNPPPSGLYASIQAWFKSGGVEPSRVSTCDALSVITRLVTNGVGASLLPVCILGAEVEGGLLRPLRVRPASPCTSCTSRSRPIRPDRDSTRWLPPPTKCSPTRGWSPACARRRRRRRSDSRRRSEHRGAGFSVGASVGIAAYTARKGALDFPSFAS